MSIWRGPFGNGEPIIGGKPKKSIVEKIDTILSDTKTEGSKAGYSRAADEYEHAYVDLKDDYDKALETIKMKKSKYNSQADSNLKELEYLRAKKLELERKVQENAELCAKQNSLSTSSVLGELSGSTSVAPAPNSIDFLDFIYNIKRKQYDKAEKLAYEEAKENFSLKLAILRDDLESLKEKSSRELNELIDIVSKLLYDISIERIKLAELYVLSE